MGLDAQLALSPVVHALDLGDVVDGPFNDSSPASSSDGSMFVLTSDRPEGFGGSDLDHTLRARREGAWATGTKRHDGKDDSNPISWSRKATPPGGIDGKAIVVRRVAGVADRRVHDWHD